MELEILENRLSVCKLESVSDFLWQGDLVFFCKTDKEISLVCETDKAPARYKKQEDGWRVIRIAGQLDFSMVGLLARMTKALAQADIPLFAVSTFDTDYLLIKEENFEESLCALELCGFTIRRFCENGLCIRKACEKDRSLLCDLAFRSKAFWGYDAAFMQACREALCVSEEYVKAHTVLVLEDAKDILGFCCLRQERDRGYLDALFIDPKHIKKGYGRMLWQQALATARTKAICAVVVESDPHAQGFYQKMGAVKIGEADSECIGGRKLPLMKIEI